jgi:hypothetical protein
LPVKDDAYQNSIQKQRESIAKNYLAFDELYELLNDAVKITDEIAKEFTASEFEKYSVIQDRLFESDFDKFVKKLFGK